MYAIIKSGSRQYQVRPESIIEVNRLPLEEGASFETDQVLLVDQDGQDIQIGSPFVSGAKVRGKVLSHLRGRKVIVFKFKRRKNYKRTRGHRQELTKVLIEGIEIGGKAVGAKKPAPAMATEKATEKPAEKPSDKEKAASDTMDKAAAPKVAKKPPASKEDDKGASKVKAAAPEDKTAPKDGKQAKASDKEKAAGKDEK
ncbi:MAG: 50S ribosomal protein L21 [bacterium]